MRRSGRDPLLDAHIPHGSTPGASEITRKNGFEDHRPERPHIRRGFRRLARFLPQFREHRLRSGVIGRDTRRLRVFQLPRVFRRQIEQSPCARGGEPHDSVRCQVSDRPSAFVRDRQSPKNLHLIATALRWETRWATYLAESTPLREKRNSWSGEPLVKCGFASLEHEERRRVCHIFHSLDPSSKQTTARAGLLSRPN